MIQKNKYNIIVFFGISYQLATATPVAITDNYDIKTYTTFTTNNIDLLINHIGLNKFFQSVTRFYSSYPRLL